jgi:serine/threonine protein kinase
MLHSGVGPVSVLPKELEGDLNQEVTTVSPDTKPKLVGKELGRYRILEWLGRGGMANVYKARDPSGGRIVAIKVLPPMMADYPQFSERFQQEAELVMRLKHPHIVPVEEIQESGDYAYQVMPYFIFGSLADQLERRRPSLEETAELVRQAGSALDYAHRQGVVHRDVKPSNILLDDKGRAMLSDFGLALILDASISLTGSAFLGTPAYISPEQAQTNKVEPHSDQYSLGIVLFQLTTGRLPFVNENPMAVILKHLNQPLPSPRSLNPDLPEGLERVILKSTAKDPGDRFGSVAEMTEALDRVMLHARDPWAISPLDLKVPPSAVEIEVADRTPPTRKRRILPAAAALAAVVGATAFFLLNNDGTAAGSAEVTPVVTDRPAVVLQISDTPEPTPTQAPPTPTDTARRLTLPPTPTPVVSYGAEDVRTLLDLDHPDYYDYFEDPQTWFDYDRPEKAAYQFFNGRLHGLDYEPDELNTWWSTYYRQSGNVYAEITATNGDCLDKDSVGIAIRVDPEAVAGGYSFEVSCDGNWRFRRHKIEGRSSELVGWIPSEFINSGKGAVNRLGIWAYQNDFIFFVNGSRVGDDVEPEYTHSYGTFAAFVRASRTFELRATFDDFAAWNIPFIP